MLTRNSFRPLGPLRSIAVAPAFATATRGYTMASAVHKSDHFRPRALPWMNMGSLRCFSSDERMGGTVKMWNEERGFGFITPNDGGEDVFVHRSALGDGVQLAPGNAVSYEGIWDDRKQKYRAAGVELAAGGADGQESSAPRTSSSSPAPIQFRSLHMVGAFADWAPSKEPMDGAEDSPVRHRLTVRAKAPQAKDDKRARREEFQILGDGSWDKRFYPAGGNHEEVVVVRPGEAGRPAASDRGKGHGRNWAVEGQPGAAFDVIFDPVARTVSCEAAFSEQKSES